MAAVVAAGFVWAGGRDGSATTQTFGNDRIVAWESPGGDGELCLFPGDAGGTGGTAARLAAALSGPPAARTAMGSQAGTDSGDAARAAVGSRAPVRMIRDRYAAFSSIAVDPTRDQVVVTDENLFQILYYSRTENTPPDQIATPARMIGAAWEDESFMSREESRTKIEFQWSVHDDGPVPPRWRFADGVFPQMRGVAIDARNEDVIITDKMLNAVVTFHLPEVFAGGAQTN